MKVVSKIINRDVIPADVDINEVPENEAVKLGYITRQEVFELGLEACLLLLDRLENVAFTLTGTLD